MPLAEALPAFAPGRTCPFRPDYPGVIAARLMITETLQPITCFISTKSEILSDHARPAH
jgi:hypothetical protein